MGFIENIIKKAQSDKKTIVLPESYEPRIIEACALILKQGIANIVMLGNREKIQAVSPQWEISGATFVDPATSPQYESYVEAFYELRKAKGMTLEKARETMLDPLYYGVMMVKQTHADGMVSGSINSTANTLRPALQILKTAPGTKLVSAFFLMIVPDCDFGADGTFVFADCGLNENPDADQLSEIAISSAHSFQQLTGKTPNVAMLSYSTYGSAKSEMTEKVIEATRLARQKVPQLNIDGELQLDAAIVGEVAKLKAPTSPVAGKANVLVFPTLDAGNIGYKLVQRLAKAEAYGPVTQGIAKPVNDLSRGCVAEDVVGVVAITAVQAQMIK